MRFRPCIDIHNGKVKQIVGSTLSDTLGAQDNFVSALDAAHYARLYKSRELYGGHIILLDPAGSEFYKADIEQARGALKAFENAMQIGGGVNKENAKEFISMGASHVIVTSYVFSNGNIDLEHLDALEKSVGKERLVLDLSCKKRGEDYYIVTDRWQRFTDVKLNEKTLETLSKHCDEFLIHAADAEGRQRGIEQKAAEICAASPIKCTYAGGIASFDDVEELSRLSGGELDFTIGSALDIFGGRLPFEKAAAYKN